LLGLSSLNLPLSGGTLNGTLNGTVATFSSNLTNAGFFTESCHLAFASPSSGISLIRNVNEISSLLSYDRTNSLYKPLIDGSSFKIQW
jgi:hypothetical protein